MAELAGGSTINGYPLVGKKANDNYITKMSGNTLVNSNIYDDGTTVRVVNYGANSFVVGDPTNLGSNQFAMSIAMTSATGIYPFGIIKGTNTNIFKISDVGAVLVYNQIQSSVATGIAPMTIASTTKVVNLNADLLDDMDTSTLAFANTIVARDTNGNIVAKQFSSTIGQGGKPFYITSTTMCDNLNADMVDGYHFDQSLLTSTTPTFSGLNTTGNYPITARLAGYKSWTMHHPSSNNLIFAASTSNGATDFSWSNTIQFSDTGNVQATSFTATTSTRGFYHRYSTDTIGMSTFRNGSSAYEIRVNENGTNWYEDSTRPTISMSLDVTAANPTSSFAYRGTGGVSWIDTMNISHLTGDVVLSDKFGTTSLVAKATIEDLTFYVRTDGNDNNSGRTAGTSGAFKTLTKALSMIPKQVNHTVQIIVNPGSYSEGLVIQGFTGSGVINVNAASWSEIPFTHNVSGQIIIARNSCRVTVTGFKTAYTINPIYVTNSNEVFLEKCASDTSGVYGVYIESAKVYLYDCIVSNKTSSAIYCHLNGEALAQDCRGGSNFAAYQASYGGRIHASGATISYTGRKLVAYEGGIATDSDGIVNPWGDNTQDRRPIVWMHRSATQNSMAGGMWHKVIFDSVPTSQKASVSVGVATVENTGWYEIKVAVGANILSGSTNQEMHIRTMLDGVEHRLATIRAQSSGETQISGSILLYIVAGQPIYSQVYCTSTFNLYGGAAWTRMSIIRVA